MHDSRRHDVYCDVIVHEWPTPASLCTIFLNVQHDITEVAYGGGGPPGWQTDGATNLSIPPWLSRFNRHSYDASKSTRMMLFFLCPPNLPPTASSFDSPATSSSHNIGTCSLSHAHALHRARHPHHTPVSLVLLRLCRPPILPSYVVRFE